MRATVDVNAWQQALVQQIAAALGQAVEATATAAPAATAPDGSGWRVSIDAGGSVTGSIIVWLDQNSAMSVTVATKHLNAEPADDVIQQVLGDVIAKAASSAAASVEGATMAVPSIQKSSMPEGSTAYDLTVEGFDPMQMAVAVSVAVATDMEEAGGPAVSAEDRLNAVLDVDLPLIVRFGGTVVPMRTLAEIAPGSMIDMQRAPNDPVDLVVGERVIARGEVVVVAGHYGVRITTLTGEARIAPIGA